MRELACYLSHLKALKEFLATDEEHALIGEDDLVLRPGFDAALDAALRYARHWNILRLTALSPGRPLPLVRLCGDYSLCVSLSRLKGTGARELHTRAPARRGCCRSSLRAPLYEICKPIPRNRLPLTGAICARRGQANFSKPL